MPANPSTSKRPAKAAAPKTSPPVEQPPPQHAELAPNVIQALARVIAEMGGVEKMTPAERRRRGLGTPDESGINYAYRGIDQIAAAAQPLLGKHGVVIAPVDIESSVREFQINNRPWTDRTTRVTWAVMGPGGVDDRILCVSEGIGRDNSDKGANKASTGAFKNLLLRLLCIGDQADDPDQHQHVSDTPSQPQRPPMHPAVQAAVDMLNTITDAEARRVAKAAFVSEFGSPAELHEEDDVHEATRWVAECVAAGGVPPGEPAPHEADEQAVEVAAEDESQDTNDDTLFDAPVDPDADHDAVGPYG